MSEDLEKKVRRTWFDTIGITVSALTVAGAFYLTSMAFKPVEVKHESGVQTESWISDYVGRRVPKQADRYTSTVNNFFGDYLNR